MHAISTFLSHNAGLIVFTTVCLSGVAFLLWFLIELQLDERRMRGRSRRSWGRLHTFKAIPIDSKRVSRAYSTKNFPESNVLSLSDKKDQNTRKMRWLVVLLILSIAIRLPATAWM